MHHLRTYFPEILLSFFGIGIYAPLLFFQKVFSGEEQIGFYYVISSYVKQSIEQGVPMTWIANYYGGLPASLDQFVGAWYPLNRFLFTYFDLFTAHHLSIVIATVAGLLFAYWFGRAQGWLEETAITFALFYFSATTFAWLWIGTTAAHSFAILPGLLLALHYGAVRHHYVLAILGGGVLLGVGFLAGFMQIVFYDYVVAGLYALYLDWHFYTRERSLFTRLRASYVWVGITITGLAVGFLQFFPSASFIDLTIRTNSYAIQHAVYPHFTEFNALFLPPYLQVPFFGGGASAGFYVTAFGLVAALLALTLYRTRIVLFFALTYALISGFAWHIPPFGWINEHLPPFSHMGGNFRWITVAAFPLAFIAAAGFEGLLRKPYLVSVRARTIIIATCIGIFLAGALGSLAVGALTSHIAESPILVENLISWYTEGRTLSYPASHYHTILVRTLNEVSASFSLMNPRFSFGIFLWLLAAFVVYAITSHTSATRKKMIVVGATVCALSGISILHWGDFVPRAIYTAEPPLISFFKSREQNQHDYRFLGYVVGDGIFLKHSGARSSPTEAAGIQMQALSNNVNLYFGVDRMDGMAPYRSLRHNHLLDMVLAYGEVAYVFDDTSPALQSSALDQLYNRDVQKKVPIEEKLADFPKRVPLLSMMNVKYIYSPYELSGVKKIATIPVTIEGQALLDLFVYENSHVLPRVYSAPAQFAHNERDALQKVITTKDFSKVALIECATCAENPASNAKIAIQSYGSGTISFTTNAAQEAWVVVSESYFPGWHAYIDDIEVPIYHANYLFQAVQVPVGAHAVRFVYEDIAIEKVRSLFE